jgi:hypothetical protein
MANRYFPVVLLLAALLPLTSLSAQSSCDCTVFATSKNGKELGYSGNCDNLQPGCTLTIKTGVKNADFSRFTDLSGVKVVIETKVNNPVFLGTSLSNNTTQFNFQDDPGTTIKVIDERGQKVTYSDNRGRGQNVDWYNRELASCPTGATCDLNNPGTPVQGLALPVTLLQYEAAVDRSSVILDWQTADEDDNAFFRVLHSTDGIAFAPLTELSGQGTTDYLSTYRYAHATPAVGLNYYQLEQVDFDGTTTVLGTRSVKVEPGAGAGAELMAYPNPAPAGSLIRLRGYETSRGTTTARLFGLTGRSYGDLMVGPDGQVTLPGDLTAGIYLLRTGNRSTRLLVRP